MSDSDIATLLRAWQSAYWNHRLTGFGFGDMGTMIEAEERIVAETLPVLQAHLEADDPGTVAEIESMLHGQGMLTPEVKESLERACKRDCLGQP